MSGFLYVVIATFILFPLFNEAIYMLPLYIIVACGSGTLPDGDHPMSLVATTFGWPGKIVCGTIDKFSAFIYYSTKTSKDPNRRSGHRAITHTLIYCIALIAVAFALSPNIYTNQLLLFICTAVSIRALSSSFKTKRKGLIQTIGKLSNLKSRPMVWIISLIVPTFIITGQMPVLNPRLLAITFAIGALGHLAGDFFTDSGIPLLWPIPIKGQTWKRFSFPIKFSTGSDQGNDIERVVRIFSWFGLLIMLVLNVIWHYK